MTVLIVDDESTSRLLLSRVIGRQFGCTVIEAANGQEAIEQLARQPFDFVLLDLMMPVMDGAQTLELIRRHDALRQLPVVVLSAVTEDVIVKRVLRLGVSDYLAKPLHPLNIVQRLSRFVEGLKPDMPPDAPADGGSADEANATSGTGASKANVQIVIADGDPRFRTFARNVLGNNYQLIEAESGAKALQRCLESSPAMLMLGEELGAVTRAMIVRKLRHEQNLRQIRIAAIVPPSRIDAAQAEGLYDVVMTRTLTPGTFKEEFQRASQPLEAFRGSGELVAGVRLQLVSTVEQVFGMMLGTEVTQQAAHASIPGLWIQASVDLTLRQEDLTFTVACSCPADTGTLIATQMQKVSSDWVGDDKAANAMGDIATILAERIQQSLEEQGRKIIASVASVRREPMKQSVPGQLLMLSFNAANGTLPFRVAVHGRPKEASAGTMTQAARNA